MGLLYNILRGLAKIQIRFGLILLIIFAVFSGFMVVKAGDMQLESNFDNLMPQQLPIYQLNNKITDKLGGQDTIFILLMLDESQESKGTPADIRDPAIMRYIVQLEDSLRHESLVDGITSVAPVVEFAESYYPTLTTENMIEAFGMIPGLSSLISDDYKKTIIMVTADAGGGEDSVLSLTNMIDEKIKGLSTPPGTKVMITGEPPIRVTVVDLLKSDSIKTLLLASAIIFVLLLIIQRNLSSTIVIFTPIVFGILWTLGTMTVLELKLSIVTAGLGAMILGLGVEYGVFMYTRYKEERSKGNDQNQALLNAVPGVGSAILGSGMTTVIGFLALTLSIMPMLQQLGLSLALGIIFCIISAVVLEPIIILYEEKFDYWYTHRKHHAIRAKRDMHKRNSL